MYLLTIGGRFPTHLENLEFGLKKFHAWENHGISKKDIFIEKSWNFVSVIHIFFQYQNKFSEFILCHLCFFLSLILDYWWLHVSKSLDV